MPDNATVTFSFSGLPGGNEYCFTTPARFALDITNNMVGYLPGQYSTIINSETEPSAEDRGKLWHVQHPGGAPSGDLYSFYLGVWVTPHPIESFSPMRMWWTGSESDLWAYDGGDGTDPSSSTPTAISGAMWEADHDYDFRFPLAAGTSATPTTVSPGDTGGEENHLLTQGETPLRSHNHEDGIPVEFSTSGYNWFGVGTQTGTKNSVQTSSTASFSNLTSTESKDGAVHNNMPPYRVGMWAKRTARVYKTA